MYTWTKQYTLINTIWFFTRICIKSLSQKWLENVSWFRCVVALFFVICSSFSALHSVRFSPLFWRSYSCIGTVSKIPSAFSCCEFKVRNLISGFSLALNIPVPISCFRSCKCWNLKWLFPQCPLCKICLLSTESLQYGSEKGFINLPGFCK